MSLEIDFAADWEVIDNIEVVTYTSVASGGDANYTVRQAIQFASMASEGGPSKGVYRQSEVDWEFPRSELPDGVIPKMRDRITSPDGTVWTVLRVDDTPMWGTWRLPCRNLAIVESLQDLVTIERASYAADSSGARVPTWAALYTNEPARLQPLTAAIAEERGLRGLRVTHSLYVGRELDVSNEDRVSFGGRYYEVRGYQQPERIDQLPRIDVELVP